MCVAFHICIASVVYPTEKLRKTTTTFSSMLKLRDCSDIYGFDVFLTYSRSELENDHTHHFDFQVHGVWL